MDFNDMVNEGRGTDKKGSSHWGQNVFSSTGGFIWRHILNFIPCFIHMA